MEYQYAKKLISDWLNSGEVISSEWRQTLQICLILIDEKLKSNNNEK